MKKLIHEYVGNKNYLAMYLHVFGDGIGGSIFSLFSGVYLYTMGMPLHFVILFFGLEYGLRGFLTPIGPILVSKIGFARAVLLSYVFVSIFYFLVAQAPESLLLAFSSFIFYSIGRAIYFPCIAAVRIACIDNKDRGKVLSLEIIIGAFSKIIGIFIATFAITYLSFIYVSVFASLSLFLFSIPLFFMKELPDFIHYSFFEPYAFLVKDEFRCNIIPLSGQAIALIVNNIFVPLFIFFLTKNINTFAAFVGIVIILDSLFSLFFGRYIDKQGAKKSTNYSTYLHVASHVLFVVFAKTPLSAFLIQSYNKITWNMCNKSFSVGIQNRAKSLNKPFLYAASHNMTLCFVQLIVLSLFSIIAYFFRQNIFIIIFIISSIVIFFTRRTFTKNL